MMSPQELYFTINKDVPVIDIRPPQEFDDAHIQGSTNIPLYRPITGEVVFFAVPVRSLIGFSSCTGWTFLVLLCFAPFLTSPGTDCRKIVGRFAVETVLALKYSKHSCVRDAGCDSRSTECTAV